MPKATTRPGPHPRVSARRPAIHSPRHILITGYPGFLGKCLVRKFCREEPESTLTLVVQEKFIESARAHVRAQNPAAPERVRILAGDVAAMHLGLSAAEIREVTRTVTDIYHLAAISYLRVARETMWRVNVRGTQNVLEVAEEARRLDRLNHVSTCYVSGDRQGVITEEELDEGQRFRNAYENTKFEAEKKIRAQLDRLPITIFRPSIVVGDSQTGEIGRFDGPYHLGILLAASPVQIPLPLPGNGQAPVNMVPVDYVIDAMTFLSRHPDAVNRTFHLVDPNPLSARRVYEIIAGRAGKKAPRLRLSASLAKTLLRLPGIEKVSRAHRQAIDYVNTMAIYNDTNTQRLLRGTPISCPPFEHYVDNLISYVRAAYQHRERDEEQASDPLI